MKKFFTISALVAASFGFAMNANAEVITWDFSEYTEQVDLGGTAFTTEYNGLTLVGNEGAAEGKEYVSAAAGFHCNGTSSTTRRYISYVPEKDGNMVVSFRSNNKEATDRITAIGSSIVIGGEDMIKEDPAVLGYAFTDGANIVTVSADLTAGTTYYFYFATGGQSIKKLEYTEAEEAAGYGLNGSGTAEDPYQITSAADFAAIAANINADNTGAGEYFALTGDIDFAGAQLPMIALGGIEKFTTVNYGFEGDLDGRGYTISGIKHDQPNKDDAAGSYVGLVSSLGENGVVRDLTIKGEINGYMYVGSVVGLMKGRVVNCNNYANITNTGAFAGGIAGGMIRGLGSICSCENNGNITADGGSYPSGILGGTQKKSDIENYVYEILDCTNNGDITGASAGAAGIAGNYIGKISDSDNYGDIKAPGCQYVGGIVACAADVLTLKKCYNYANVVGGFKVGGIAGEIRHAETLLDGCINAGLLVNDEEFEGDVCGTHEDETKVKNVGGVVGNSTKVGATIKHCASLTSVTVPASVETAGHLIGNAEIIVEDCYFYAPDAILPLDDAALQVDNLETALTKWIDLFKGNMVATVMEQNIEFEDQTIGIEYATSDEAYILIPSISYAGFTIDAFSVPVSYTVTEDGCVYSSGAFTAIAGQYTIDGQSIDGVKTGKNLTLTTVFMVGGMPMPLTVTFNGELEELDPTPVETIETIEAVGSDSAKYDLQGRRTNGESGLFIQNGKVSIVR